MLTPATRQILFGTTDGRNAQVIRLSQMRRGAATNFSPMTRATGTWTEDEHERFLEALDLYPSGPWNRIAGLVATRDRRQVMTHAQKYRQRLVRNNQQTSMSPLQTVDNVPALADRPMTIAVTAGVTTGERQLDADSVDIPGETEEGLVFPKFDLESIHELLTGTYWDGFDMTSPGAEFEPLQLNE